MDIDPALASSGGGDRGRGDLARDFSFILALGARALPCCCCCCCFTLSGVSVCLLCEVAGEAILLASSFRGVLDGVEPRLERLKLRSLEGDDLPDLGSPSLASNATPDSNLSKCWGLCLWTCSVIERRWIRRMFCSTSSNSRSSSFVLSRDLSSSSWGRKEKRCYNRITSTLVLRIFSQTQIRRLCYESVLIPTILFRKKKWQPTNYERLWNIWYQYLSLKIQHSYTSLIINIIFNLPHTNKALQ